MTFGPCLVYSTTHNHYMGCDMHCEEERQHHNRPWKRHTSVCINFQYRSDQTGYVEFHWIPVSSRIFWCKNTKAQVAGEFNLLVKCRGLSIKNSFKQPCIRMTHRQKYGKCNQKNYKAGRTDECERTSKTTDVKLCKNMRAEHSENYTHWAIHLC